VLRLVCRHTYSDALLERLIQVTCDAQTWEEGRSLFEDLRDEVLRLERGDVSSPRADTLPVLYLAENVAKVTWNASGQAPPFDHDAGWWIARCLADVLAAQDNAQKFADEAWEVLTQLS
jgi:hypothetical protein